MGSSTTAITVSLTLHFFKGSGNFIPSAILAQPEKPDSTSLSVSVLFHRHALCRCFMKNLEVAPKFSQNSISGQQYRGTSTKIDVIFYPSALSLIMNFVITLSI